MPDIPLHSLRRGTHNYTSLPDEEPQAGNSSSSPSKMNRAGRAAVAASSSRRIFSGNKRTERYTDDPEEAAGLLATEDGDIEDDGVQEPSPPQSVRHSVHVYSIFLIAVRSETTLNTEILSKGQISNNTVPEACR